MTSDIQIIKNYFGKSFSDINIDDIDKLFSDNNHNYIEILQKNPNIIDTIIKDQLLKTKPDNDVIQILTPISYQVHLDNSITLHDKLSSDKSVDYQKKLPELEKDSDIFIRIIAYLQNLYLFPDKCDCKELFENIKKDIDTIKNYCCDMINSRNLEATFYLISNLLTIIFRINSKYTSLYSKNVLEDSDNRFLKALSVFYEFELKLIEKQSIEQLKKKD